MEQFTRVGRRTNNVSYFNGELDVEAFYERMKALVKAQEERFKQATTPPEWGEVAP